MYVLRNEACLKMEHRTMHTKTHCYGFIPYCSMATIPEACVYVRGRVCVIERDRLRERGTGGRGQSTQLCRNHIG